MTAREQLISYVKNGGEKFLCSPQIGAGAGFDTKLAGKSWIGDTTLEDTRRAWEMAKKMGRKHILGASDYMFYQTPVENVTAMADAVREFNAANT